MDITALLAIVSLVRTLVASYRRTYVRFDNDTIERDLIRAMRHLSPALKQQVQEELDRLTLPRAICDQLDSCLRLVAWRLEDGDLSDCDELEGMRSTLTQSIVMLAVFIKGDAELREIRNHLITLKQRIV